MFVPNPGNGLVDPDALAKFAAHPLALDSLEKYMEWLNQWDRLGDRHDYTAEDFFKWGQTEIVLDTEFEDGQREIFVYSVGDGDDGGPAMVTVQAERWPTSELSIVSITQEFDTMTSLVYDGEKVVIR